MTVTKLQLNAGKKLVCPKCGAELRYVAGGAVRVVNGKVDMDATLPKQVCDHCKIFYRELLHSGYYDEFPLEEADAKPVEPKPVSKPAQKPAPKPVVKPSAKPARSPAPKKRVIATGDIPPTQLKREADGKCPCPRCGERMDFVPAGPVRIVNGRPDFSNTMDHFVCPYCKSVFRKIVGTDYFQWSAN